MYKFNKTSQYFSHKKSFIHSVSKHKLEIDFAFASLKTLSKIGECSEEWQQLYETVL